MAVRKRTWPKDWNEQKQAALDNYGRMAAKSGCPPDQWQNFVNAGIWLQPKQLEFAAAARECDKDGGPFSIMAGGGRGSAKTHGAMAQIFVDDCCRCDDLQGLVLRKVGKSNKEQIQDFQKRILCNVPHTYKEQAGVIQITKTRSMVRLGHYKNDTDIDNYLGREFDFILIEEANQVSQSKTKNIISCLRTSKPNWRPRLYLTTNPGGVNHATNKAIYVDTWTNGTQTNTRYIHSTVDDNAFVNKDYKSILESYTGWMRLAWLLGSWDFAAGQFFINWTPSVHVYPNDKIKFHENEAVRWLASFDYGWNHFTVFILACEDKFGNIFVIDRYRGRLKTVQEHSAHIHAMLKSHNLNSRSLSVASGKDCFSKHPDGTTIAEQYSNCGIDLIPAEIDRVNGWAECLRRMGDPANDIAPSVFINVKCTELIAQLPMLQHDPDKPEDVLKVDINSEDGTGGDDDSDCFRFLLSTNPSVGEMKMAMPVAVGGYVAIGM